MDIFPVRHSTGTKTQFEPNQMQSSYNSYKETLHTETILNLTKLKPYFRSLLQHTVRKQAYITAARSQAGLINHKSRHMAQKTSNLHTEMSHRKTTSISCTRKNVQQNYRLNLAEKQNARPSRHLGWHCETLDSYTSVGHVFTMGGGIIMEETCQCDTYAVCYF